MDGAGGLMRLQKETRVKRKDPAGAAWMPRFRSRPMIGPGWKGCYDIVPDRYSPWNGWPGWQKTTTGRLPSTQTDARRTLATVLGALGTVGPTG
jgi:hypothetical protein